MVDERPRTLKLIRSLFILPLLLLHSGLARAADRISLPGSAPGNSSVVIAEIDGNPANGLEIAVGTRDGQLHVLAADGAPLWSRDLPNRSCTLSGNSDKLYSSPAVGELFGNGVPHVVIGYGGFRGKDCDGGVAAFRGSDGAPTWNFSIRSFAKRKRFFAYRHAVVTTPALSDTDGDGQLEVGFGGFDRSIYLLSAQGKVRWYTQAADTVFSSAAFLDVDGDGFKEMIIGTDISQNKIINPPTPNGGYLYALRSKPNAPRRQSFFRFRDPRLALWRVQFDQVIQSSPVVAELVQGNAGREIVVGSGCFFPQDGGVRRGRWFKVFSAKTGELLRTLSIPECSPSSAAVADLDGDSINEVVVSTNAPRSGGQSHLIAWRPQTDTVMWDQVLTVGGRGDPFGAEYNRSPIIADLDGNGSLEVAVAHDRGIAVVSASTGAPLSCMLPQCAEVKLRTPSLAQGTPAFGDADGDGTPELYLGAAQSRSGVVVRWSSELSSLNSSPGTLAPFTAPWPIGRGGAMRNGVF